MTYFEIRNIEDAQIFRQYKDEINQHKSWVVRGEYFREDRDMFRWESDLREIEEKWRQIFTERPAIRDSEPDIEPTPKRPRVPKEPRPSSRRSARIAKKNGVLEAAEGLMALGLD